MLMNTHQAIEKRDTGSFKIYEKDYVKGVFCVHIQW